MPKANDSCLIKGIQISAFINKMKLCKDILMKLVFFTHNVHAKRRVFYVRFSYLLAVAQ